VVGHCVDLNSTDFLVLPKIDYFCRLGLGSLGAVYWPGFYTPLLLQAADDELRLILDIMIHDNGEH
jgi:hypothetical protein